MKPGKIVLHIDEILVNGFDHTDPQRVRQAVERELTQLITQKGLAESLTSDSEFSHINGGNIRIEQGHNSDTLGTRVAGNIYQGISQNTGGIK